MDLINVKYVQGYAIEKRLEEGKNGKVYLVVKNNTKFALKVLRESKEKKPLTAEIELLKRIKNISGGDHFVDILKEGYDTKLDFRFAFFTLVGLSINKIRTTRYEKKFSKSTAIKSGIEMFKALEEIHKTGYVARNVGLDGFALDYYNLKKIYLTDLRIFKQWPPENYKKTSNLRGSVTYASLNAHKFNQLMPIDDCVSWFFCLVHMTCGKLPWKSDNDQSIVKDAKKKAWNQPKDMLQDSPSVYHDILDILKSHNAISKIDYCRILKLLDKALTDTEKTRPYDWEPEAIEMIEQKFKARYDKVDIYLEENRSRVCFNNKKFAAKDTKAIRQNEVVSLKCVEPKCTGTVKCRTLEKMDVCFIIDQTLNNHQCDRPQVNTGPTPAANPFGPVVESGSTAAKVFQEVRK